MRFYLILLATLCASLHAMEKQSTPRTVFSPLSLQQLCINRLTALLTEPPNSIVRSHVGFEKLFELNKLQQDNAHWLENNMLKHLLKRLKKNIVVSYKEYLEGSPWRSVAPEVQTQSFCKDPDSSHLCDYSSKQKLIATIQKNQTWLLLLENAHNKKCMPTLQSVIDIKQYIPLVALKFSPQGSFLALTYLNEHKKKSLAFLDTKSAMNEDTEECLLSIPLKDTDMASSLLFTHDDQFAVSHSKGRLDMFDLECLDDGTERALPKISSIKRAYRCIVMSPTMHLFAARDSNGTIDVYKITQERKVGFVGTIRCAPQHVKMHWLACGSILLIQDRQTNILWDPINDIKANTLGRLPYIASYQVAHSPCQKYIAYRTLKGVCILNLKTEEWSRIEHYYPERMHFNEDSSLIGILNNAQLVEHQSYEFNAMPLDQLIIYCLLAKHVLKTDQMASRQNVDKKNVQPTTLVSLIRNANSLCSQQGFIRLPTNIREDLFTHVYQTLQTRARKLDPSSIMVVHVHDTSRAVAFELPNEKK